MSLKEVSKFFDYVRKKGIVASNTVTGWSGALGAIESVLDDEEKTLDYILDNADVIRVRLQNQNHDISGETLNIYIQRSKRAIKAFRNWSDDRAAWEKEMASSKSKPTGPNKGNSSNKNKKEKLTKLSESSFSNSENSEKKIFPIPTGRGDTFDVALPKSYTMDDLPRVIWALAVYAEDFNPAVVLEKYGKPPIKPSTSNDRNFPVPVIQQ